MRLASMISMLLLAGIPAVLAGCGSSYIDNERSAVSHLQSIIQTYNGSQGNDLTATGSACSKASSELQPQKDQLTRSSAPGKYRPAADAVRQAYTLAEAGFADCSQAASRLSYPLMTRANLQIDKANGWIQRARALDRS